VQNYLKEYYLLSGDDSMESYKTRSLENNIPEMKEKLKQLLEKKK